MASAVENRFASGGAVFQPVAKRRLSVAGTAAVGILSSVDTPPAKVRIRRAQAAAAAALVPSPPSPLVGGSARRALWRDDISSSQPLRRRCKRGSHEESTGSFNKRRGACLASVRIRCARDPHDSAGRCKQGKRGRRWTMSRQVRAADTLHRRCRYGSTTINATIR